MLLRLHTQYIFVPGNVYIHLYVIIHVYKGEMGQKKQNLPGSTGSHDEILK